MSKCPLCGSDGDDLVFRFYCPNKGCANFVPEKEQGKVQARTKERLAPEVKCPLFTQAKLNLRSFHKGFQKGSFPKDTYRREIQAEWLDTDRDLEVMKEHIYAGLGVPREFLEPGCGSLPGKDFPHFKLVLSPFDNSLMLYWYDQVPAVLNTLIRPILENKVGTPMTSRFEGTTQHQIIEHLLGMVRKRQLVRNEARCRWELHFTE
jgi:ssDNA-binding Zn-finger/Zn-ribbon topoisomerase 1